MFVGEGNEKDKVEQFCDEKNLENVLFLGLRNDVNKLYQAFDVFAFPSFFEGIPLSIIEAETSGLPCVISTDVPSGIDYANNIYFVDLKKPEDWIAIISDLKDKKVDRFSNYNLTIKNGYDISESCKELEKIYMELIRGQ